MENTQNKPYDCSVYDLREFIDCPRGKRNPNKAQRIPWILETEPKQKRLECDGQTAREERATQKENSEDPQRVLLMSSTEHWQAYVYEKITWDQRKNHSEGFEWTLYRAQKS